MKGPHEGRPVLRAGTPLEQANAAMMLVHGRGAGAESILTLVPELSHSEIAYLAPDAQGATWYPFSFLSPIERNEPGITSGIAALADVLELIGAAGIPPERTMILGFSQGACLALEFVARNARCYGGVVGLSGGLIGPDGTPRDYAGSLDGTPVFLGCGDDDDHIPKERVELTAQVLQQLGASVTMRLYPNMGHTVNADEIAFVRDMIATMI